MSRNFPGFGGLFAILIASCATGQGNGEAAGAQATGDAGVDGAPICSTCDSDGDGVPDGSDSCPGTPSGAAVDKVGCADAQLTPKLEPLFPAYGLTFTATGDLGRAGGLTWTYTGIQRADLFHIYWVVCDEPGEACGLSLHGPIAPSDFWVYDATSSDLPNGKVVFTNSSTIALAGDGGLPSVKGRLTVTIADAKNAAIPFVDVESVGIRARAGKNAAEITGTAFKVVAVAEVQSLATAAWTPYLDYYDAAATPDTGDAGGNAFVSFGGSFYDK